MILPGNPPKTGLSSAAHHGIRQPAQGTQIARAFHTQRADIRKRSDIQGRYRIQPEQAESYVTKVNTRHRPITHPFGTQCASVADTLVENSKSVAELVAVFPKRPKYF